MPNPSKPPVHPSSSRPTRAPRRLIRALCVVATLGATIAGFPGVSAAAPIDDLRNKAQALEAQLAENGAKIAGLGEQLNAAQLQLDEAQANIADAEARIVTAKAEATRLTGLVRARAVSIYQRGGTQVLPGLDSDVTEANVRQKYAAAATGRDRELLDRSPWRAPTSR